MEGLANYGSDDEIDGPPIAANETKNNNHHHPNELKNDDARHHQHRSSSSGPDHKDEHKSRHQNSTRERKTDIRYNSKEYEDDKYRMKSTRDTKPSSKSERYHERDYKSERNRDRNYREKRDYDIKKDSHQHSSREKRYRDNRDERHYKSRDERRYDERSDRTQTRTERHKREHENDRHQTEYKSKEVLPKKNDDQYRDRSERNEKRYRDDEKYDKYNRKDYATEKNCKNGSQEHLSARNREKYNKSDSPPNTSTEHHQLYTHSRSRTPTRHPSSNYDEEKKELNKRHVEDKDLDKQLRKYEQTVPITTQLIKPTTPPVVPLQAHASSPIPLPKYYNPSVVNVNKYAEQVQKRKLLWSGKKTEDNASKWGKPQFSEDSDGKVASKFLRLMGIKNADSSESAKDSKTSPVAKDPNVQSREAMFSSMEQQYEVARQVTHTMRGVGLGFSSQSRPF